MQLEVQVSFKWQVKTLIYFVARLITLTHTCQEEMMSRTGKNSGVFHYQGGKLGREY